MKRTAFITLLMTCVLALSAQELPQFNLNRDYASSLPYTPSVEGTTAYAGIDRAHRATNHNYIGVAAGYTFFDFRQGYTKQNYNHSDVHGLNIGLTVHQKLFLFLYVNTGVYYQYGTSKQFQLGSDINSRINMHSIQVPLRLAFTFGIGNSNTISIMGGPVFSFTPCLESRTGSSKNYIAQNMINGKTTVAVDGTKTITDAGKGTKRFFDVPVGIGAAVKLGHFGIYLNYEWGTINRERVTDFRMLNDQLTAGVMVVF